MPRQLTSTTTLDNLKREARRWLNALRQNDAAAHERFQRAYPKHAGEPVLRDLQHALACEFAFENWKELKSAIQREAVSRTIETYQQAAQHFVDAYKGDIGALENLNHFYKRVFDLNDLKAEIWRRDYAFRQRSSRVPENYFPLAEAQLLLAQDAGFGSWEKLLRALEEGRPPQGAPYVLDTKKNGIGSRRRMSESDWDQLIGVMKERRIPRLTANGMMTDAALAKIAKLDFVTSLDLGGSRELSDDGLLQLAQMPQLQRLNLSEYPGGKLTDRGMEVLRHLPALREFEMTWQSGITDQGGSNLRFCDQLEIVDLMGSPTGDGVVEALQGKAKLRRLSTGRLLTDAAIPLLHQFPQMKTKTGMGFRLLLDGPITNAGLAMFAGLDGVTELDLFWHVSQITTDGFVHLRQMSNLEFLGCDGKLSDDIAMRHMGMLPKLKRVRIQESIASDDGFEALAKSQTIENVWGRVSPHFGNRGFLAFSKMPRLRTMGIGCRNVDDAVLSTLPEFPALRELTPIDFNDDGFKHISRCAMLERLSCMYCRETGDAATEALGELSIRFYHAGLTQITDYSLEVLGKMKSLEQVELYECLKITDAGLPFLAKLPRLQEVHLDGLPGVTLNGTRVFLPQVQVYYSA